MLISKLYFFSNYQIYAKESNEPLRNELKVLPDYIEERLHLWDSLKTIQDQELLDRPSEPIKVSWF